MLARSEEMQRMRDYFSSVQHSLTSWPSIEERHAFEAYDKVRFFFLPVWHSYPNVPFRYTASEQLL